jgi:hypothetical protein
MQPDLTSFLEQFSVAGKSLDAKGVVQRGEPGMLECRVTHPQRR